MVIGFLSGTDLAVVVTIAAVVMSGMFLSHRRLTVKFGSVEASIGEVAETVAAIDHAVNGRPASEQTISQDVRQLRMTVVPMRQEVTMMAGQMAEVRRDLASTKTELTAARTEQAMQGERLREVARKADVAVAKAEVAADDAKRVAAKLLRGD